MWLFVMSAIIMSSTWCGRQPSSASVAQPGFLPFGMISSLAFSTRPHIVLASSFCVQVSAADGAEEHYQLANNVARSEGLGHACELDKKTQQAWVGHPYVDIIDNSTTFDEKVQRVVDAICERFQVPILNPRRAGTRKHKFLVDSTQSTVRARSLRACFEPPRG